jgi:hypothetical protein
MSAEGTRRIVEPIPTSPEAARGTRLKIVLGLAGVLVMAVLVWQAVTAHGVPDPTRNPASPLAAILDTAVLVFREGLECILVLSAITASMKGPQQAHRRPVAGGAVLGFVATVITWFIAVGILDSLADNVSALNLQAATGLLAIVVLLVVMNWFFPQDVLGRLDLAAQPQEEITARRSRGWPDQGPPPGLGAGAARIQLVLPRRV